jgi:3-oxoacyl-[acyl-carrier-protein] synthase-3
LGKVDEGYGLISSYIGADGSQGNNITIPNLYIPEEDVERRSKFENKRTLWQDGQEVFKFAIKSCLLQQRRYWKIQALQ